MGGVETEQYVRLLERWIRGAEPYLYVCPDRPELTCYGTGVNTWGVQTNQKAFAAFAMLAVHPDYDEARAGRSRDFVLDTALRLLRYCLHTHKEGTYTCTDGTSWGHTWISVLGTERMMHAVEAIEPFMTAEDRSLLRTVLLSESDWLLEHYEIVAGLYAKDGNNKPESNLWNGAFLHRTAAMYPDAPRAAEYREKGSVFLVNAISVPEDAASGEMVDGKRIAERYAGANFFSSYALNHHGYLNVGYMVICLSNMAMYHFACRRNGFRPPESLYRHWRELWDVVKLCTFPDGRLARIGGDTRVRYTYCQDYVIPVWHMAADLAGDPDCEGFEAGWLAQIESEMDASGDGTFLSYRCRALQEASPLYFTRLESDRACVLSMALAWRDMVLEKREGGECKAPAAREAATEAVSATADGAWHDDYHGAYLQRGARRIASWVWDAAEKPQGLCLPPEASDMAEWKENMAGRLQGLGQITKQLPEKHGGCSFPGGFLTWGSTTVRTLALLGEGEQDEDMARSRIVCAALPDDATMIVLQQATAIKQRTFIRSVKGLNLLMPNDVFNGNHRTYYTANGKLLLHGYGSAEEIVPTGSRWLCVDNKLGVIAVYGTDEIAISRPGRRQIGLSDGPKTTGMERTLYADAIAGPCTAKLQSYAAGDTVLDTGYVMLSGKTCDETAKLAGDSRLLSGIDSDSPYLRGVTVQGTDGGIYVLAANFGESDEEWAIAMSADGIDVASGAAIRPDSEGYWKLRLEAGAARLLRLLQQV